MKDSNKNIGAFRWAYQYGLTKDRKLEPARNCTRAEMVGFIYGYNGTYHVIP